jgi:hypothetical protein
MTITDDSSVIDNEQLMVSGTLGKIHLQLRRLNNDVSLQLPENVEEEFRNHKISHDTSTERPSPSADFPQQPVVGSAPSHSSHLSFRLKSEKGTPTMEQEKIDHQQLFQQQQQSSQQHTPQQPPLSTLKQGVGRSL